MREAAYIADEDLSTAAFLALALGKPLLLEGAPGTGKTEAGKALAEVLDRDLVRLQCYEGMDSSAALYEWNTRRRCWSFAAAASAASTSTMSPS